MRLKEILKDNKGYSLTEMIIVIAIIAILSGAALSTITLINSAKAKEAGVTFDSEVTALKAKSKSQKVKFDDGSGTVEEHDGYLFAIAVYKKNGKSYIADGYYDKTTGKFYTYDAENTNSEGTELSKRISVKYEAGYKNDGTNTANIYGTEYEDSYVIAFDSDGSCVSGVGTYDFLKNGDVVLDEVTIRVNGSRQTT